MAPHPPDQRRQAKPKVFDLRIAQVINAYNDILDIQDLIMEFSITEDLYNPFLTGYILVNDSLGLIERFPLLGEELLYFEYSSPGVGDLPYHKKYFRVMEIGERKRDRVDVEMYAIHFVSNEYFVDMTTTINKTYISEKPGDIVRKIYKNYIDPQKEISLANIITKPLHICNDYKIYEPQMRLTIQSPTRSPFQLINQICEETGMTFHQNLTDDARPETWGDFIFFERHDGFHFTSMSLLQKGCGGFGESYFHGFQNLDFDDQYKDVVEQPTKGDRRSSYSDSAESILAAKGAGESYSLPGGGGGYRYYGNAVKKRLTEITLAEKAQQRHTFNVARDHEEGMYDNTVSYIDPLIKKYEKKVFIYDRDFDQLSGTASFAGNARVTTKDSIYRNLTGNSTTAYIPTNIVPNKELPDSEKVGTTHLIYEYMPYFEDRVSKDGNVYDHRAVAPRTKHKWLNHKTAAWASFDHTVIDITIPGDSRATVGTLIEWYTPMITDVDDHKKRTSPSFGNSNGSYFLITAVEQKFNKVSDLHYTIIQMIKTNYAQKLEKIQLVYGITENAEEDAF